jgi:site-specific recombinase XerD
MLTTSEDTLPEDALPKTGATGKPSRQEIRQEIEEVMPNTALEAVPEAVPEATAQLGHLLRESDAESPPSGSHVGLVELAPNSIALEDESAAQGLAVAVDTLIAGVLSEHSRRAYIGDIRHFLSYLAERELALPDVSKNVLVTYRAFLARGYAPSTVNRRLTVARRLVTEAWDLGLLTVQGRNPADGRSVAGLRDAGDRGQPALTLQQARVLLQTAGQVGDLASLRDTAILHLLIGTGLRRSELAALRLANVQVQGGYNVLVVLGKGNKRRVVKLTQEVADDLYTWLLAVGRGRVADGHLIVTDPSLPLFSPVKRVGRGKEARWEVTGKPLSAWGVWDIVTRRIAGAGLDVDTSPHGLRATFITLALEGGASMSRVQDAAGHKDPRTTDRYRRRKASLDDNAADYVKLMERPKAQEREQEQEQELQNEERL